MTPALRLALSLPISFSAALAATLSGCTTLDVEDGDELDEVALGTTESASVVTPPAGMGRYCSMSWAGGGWGFASYTNLTSDPCAYLQGSSGTGTVERAGLYSTSGVNNVVLRCEGGSYIMLGIGTGNGPLTWAYNQAAGHSGCIFTVAPRELPIFACPYATSGYLFTNTGFDFARGFTVDAKNELGDPAGGTAANKIDWRGKDMSAWGYNNHDAWDINMTTGTPIYAAANGTVQMARFRDITNACPGGYTIPNQGEVFIKHTIDGGAGSLFDEKLISYYAHFSSIAVSTGQVVNKGDLIGYSGTTGCSSDPHLHFGTFRLTNTASEKNYPFVINTNFAAGQDQNSANGYRIAIEPRGFYPAQGFDPWAWRAYPDGALSINLWQSGAAPPAGSW